MKRVFCSTEANNDCGDVTARVVVFRKPTSTLDDEDQDTEAEMEEEDHAKFATLEASYPTHI